MTAGLALSKCGSMIAGGYYFSLRGIAIEQLTVFLSRTLRRPVVDQTKLAGAFDIDLAFTPDSPTPGPVSANAPSLFTAVQDSSASSSTRDAFQLTSSSSNRDAGEHRSEMVDAGGIHFIDSLPR
jgi:Protein of unknown function (DUF3738)